MKISAKMRAKMNGLSLAAHLRKRRQRRDEQDRILAMGVKANMLKLDELRTMTREQARAKLAQWAAQAGHSQEEVDRLNARSGNRP